MSTYFEGVRPKKIYDFCSNSSPYLWPVVICFMWPLNEETDSTNSKKSQMHSVNLIVFPFQVRHSSLITRHFYLGLYWTHIKWCSRPSILRKPRIEAYYSLTQEPLQYSLTSKRIHTSKMRIIFLKV